MRESHFLAFWRGLNSRLADFGRLPATFGEAHVAYEEAMTAAARFVLCGRQQAH